LDEFGRGVCQSAPKSTPNDTEGRNVHYRADPKGLAPLVDWMALYGVFWRERFANLRTLLKEIDP
jgi:hypothetical protein